MKKIYYCYADLETTKVVLPKQYKNFRKYYQEDKNPKYPQVYSWGFMYSDKYPKLVNGFNYEHDEIRKVHYHCGIDINEFVNLMKQLSNDVKIFFNNSKGFDNHFIYPALDKNGYHQIPPLKDEEYKDIPEPYKSYLKKLRERRFQYLLSLIKSSKKGKEMTLSELSDAVKKRWNALLKNEYRLMVNNNTQILKISLSTDQTYWSMGIKRHRVIHILDNLLLFAGSIKGIGEDVAKYKIKNGMKKEDAEKLFHKQEIAYDRTEPYKSLEEFKNDGNEYSYLKQDIYILYEYHYLIENYFPREEWKLTAGATTYHNWKKAFADEYINKLLKTKSVKKIKVKNGGYKYTYKSKLYSETQLAEQILNELLPTKWLSKETEYFSTTHQEIYQWFKGGITMVNETFRGQYVENVSIADINSSYSNNMSLNVGAPIGVGKQGDIKGYDFKLYTMYVKEDITNEKGLPFLTPIFDAKRNYPKTLKKGSIIYLDTYEYQRFQKYYTNDKSKYDLEIKWSFMTTPIKNLFGFYISKNYKIKQQASQEKDTILKNIAKIFLNSLYGKFATKITRESKIWDANQKEWLSITQKLEPDYYLPIALAITSLARMQLVDACDIHYDKFVYCDTDSLFIKDFDPKLFTNMKLDPNKLGYWDIEKTGLSGIVRRPKQYLFFDKNGKRKVAFAGINFNKDILPDEDLEIIEDSEIDKIVNSLQLIDFVNGRKIENQTSPFKVLGQGIIIQTAFKDIKPIWDYKKLPEQKYYLEKHFEKTLKIIDKIKY